MLLALLRKQTPLGPVRSIARNLFVGLRFYLQDFIYKCVSSCFLLCFASKPLRGAKPGGPASNMSIEARERLRKQRGTPVFVYDVSQAWVAYASHPPA
jgi:hypothetical protein